MDKKIFVQTVPDNFPYIFVLFNRNSTDCVVMNLFGAFDGTIDSDRIFNIVKEYDADLAREITIALQWHSYNAFIIINESEMEGSVDEFIKYMPQETGCKVVKEK